MLCCAVNAWGGAVRGEVLDEGRQEEGERGESCEHSVSAELGTDLGAGRDVFEVLLQHHRLRVGTNEVDLETTHLQTHARTHTHTHTQKHTHTRP